MPMESPGILAWGEELDEYAAAPGGQLAVMRCEFADIKADLRVLKWSQAATFAGVVAIILKLFLHS